MVFEHLKKALLEKKLPNTLLFSGFAKETKRIALWLSSELLKTNNPEIHPDFHLIAPIGKGAGKGGLHIIENIRNGIDFSHTAPYSAPAKVILIESAEQMQSAAANALLKTLEEPVLDSYWILLSERVQGMLSTILSRCAKFCLPPSEVELDTLELQEAKTLLHSLLEAPFSYIKLCSVLEKLEELMEEKDPTPLFMTLAHAFRQKEEFWHEALEQARVGIERNIKLSTCLETLFLTVCDLHSQGALLHKSVN